MAVRPLRKGRVPEYEFNYAPELAHSCSSCTNRNLEKALENIEKQRDEVEEVAARKVRGGMHGWHEDEVGAMQLVFLFLGRLQMFVLVRVELKTLPTRDVGMKQ